MAAAVAAHTQTPPAMAVLSILSVLAAVLQRRFEVAPYGDDYREPLSIWTVTALGSGNRKTAVHRALTGVLVDWEKVQRDRMRKEIAIVYAQREVIGKRIETLKLQAGKEQDAKVRQRLQDEIAELKESMPGELYAPRLFSGDITAERLQQLLVEQDERAAIVTDEGGVFQIMAGQYSGGMSSIDVFLQGHSGSSMRVDRAGAHGAPGPAGAHAGAGAAARHPAGRGQDEAVPRQRGHGAMPVRGAKVDAGHAGTCAIGTRSRPGCARTTTSWSSSYWTACGGRSAHRACCPSTPMPWKPGSICASASRARSERAAGTRT